MFRNRVRTYALIGAVAVAGVLAAVVPALGNNQEDAVRLHLGSDYQAFTYAGSTQPISATRCEVQNSPDPTGTNPEYRLVELSANKRGPGLDSLGIGVKSGGAQGTPCGRVDSTEALTLKIRNGEGFPLEGRTFDGLRLDLELKGGALVNITLKLNGVADPGGPFRLASGSSIGDPPGDESPFPAPTDPDPAGGYRATSDADNRRASCAGFSDSGPDSGANDNCLWTITGVEFDEVVMTAEVGEFSLEGSGDYGNDPAFDTLFYVANQRPNAVDDNATTYSGGSREIDVLANDTDDDPLSVSAFTQPPGGEGSVVASANGLTYTAPDDFTGTTSFTYTASDGVLTDTATVTVRVDPVIDCVDPLTIDKMGITASYTRYSGDGCPAKPVVIDVITTEKVVDGVTHHVPTLVFQPRPTNGDPVDCSTLPRLAGCIDEFEGVISFGPRSAGNPSNTGLLEYDPSDDDQFDFRSMRWCETAPQFDAEDPATRPTPDQILPGPIDPVNSPEQGESWCIVSETTTVDGNGKTVTTWTLYGIGDPFKRLS